MAADKPYLRVVEPHTKAQKATRTTLDTIVVSPAMVRGWKLPSFQRPLKVNTKVMDVMREIMETQVIPGVLTIGVIDKIHYLVDGQHRREAFLLADIPEAFVDVRYTHFDNEAEMADEFIKVNQRLNNLKPDDILRGMEKSNKQLAKIRREFSGVGYDSIRRNDKSPVVSMSALIRCWYGSQPEVPSLGGMSVQDIVSGLTDDEVKTILEFCEIAWNAWGRDPEHYRLWSNLNLTIVMWLYRRLVITPYSANIKKVSREHFQKCLMSLGANGEYHDWLQGRNNLNKHHRSPTYQRIKGMFAKRLEEETGTKWRLPSPEWGGR